MPYFSTVMLLNIKKSEVPGWHSENCLTFCFSKPFKETLLLFLFSGYHGNHILVWRYILIWLAAQWRMIAKLPFKQKVLGLNPSLESFCIKLACPSCMGFIWVLLLPPTVPKPDCWHCLVDWLFDKQAKKVNG